MKTLELISLLALAELTGCQQLTKPDPQQLERMPVIEFGQTVPDNGEFVLHFPRDQPIPVTAYIKGNAFSQGDEKTLTVVLQRDIYNYREWVSFDRTHWQYSPDVVDFSFNLQIPDYFNPHPGRMGFQFNLK